MATFGEGDALRSPRVLDGEQGTSAEFSRGGIYDDEGDEGPPEGVSGQAWLQMQIARTVEETQDEKWALRYLAAGKLWGDGLIAAFKERGGDAGWFESLEEPQKDFLERRQDAVDSAAALERQRERTKHSGHHVYGGCAIAPADDVDEEDRRCVLTANARRLLDPDRWPRVGVCDRAGKLLGPEGAPVHELVWLPCRPGATDPAATLWSAGHDRIVLQDEDPNDDATGEIIAGCVFAGFADVAVACDGVLHLTSVRDTDPTFVAAHKRCFVEGCDAAVVADGAGTGREVGQLHTAPLSVACPSFRPRFGRAVISRSEASMLFCLERARAEGDPRRSITLVLPRSWTTRSSTAATTPSCLARAPTAGASSATSAAASSSPSSSPSTSTSSNRPTR